MATRGIRTHAGPNCAKKARMAAEAAGMRWFDSWGSKYTHLVFVEPISDGTPPYVATANKYRNHKQMRDTVKVDFNYFINVLKGLKLQEVKDDS